MDQTTATITTAKAGMTVAETHEAWHEVRGASAESGGGRCVGIDVGKRRYEMHLVRHSFYTLYTSPARCQQSR